MLARKNPTPTSGFQHILLLIAVFVFIVVAVTIFFLQSQPKSEQQAPDTQQSQKAPKVSFQSVTLQTLAPVIPQQVRTYFLKSGFSKDDVTSLAQRFGLTTVSMGDNTDKNAIAYSLDTPQNRGLLTVNKLTGEFSYQSWGNMTLPTSGQKPTDKGLAVSRYLGFTDPALTCPITYKKKTSPADTTYVECHSDWSKVGLPISSIIGMLNLPEGTVLTNLPPGSTDPSFPNAEEIYAVTLNDQPVASATGKMRPNDYNTITIAFTRDGKITSIDSTMRWVIKAGEPIPPSEIMSFEQAVQKVRDNDVAVAFTIPAGSGIVDWQKAYPQNLARGQQATVTNATLVYLEKPYGVEQKQYQPYYLFQGTATLDSGYTVKFAEAVPALQQDDKRQAISLFKKGVVAGVSTMIAQGKTVQLNNFLPGTSQSTPPTTTKPPAGPTPPPAAPSACLPINTHDITLQVPGYGTLVVATNPGPISSGSQGPGGNSDVGSKLRTYFLKSTTGSNKDLDTVRQKFAAIAKEQYLTLLARSALGDTAEFGKANTLDKMKDYIQYNSQYTDPVTNFSYFYGPPSPPLTKYFTNVLTESAQKLLEAKQQGKVQELANKQDIFPPETFANFSYMFQENDIEKDKACYITGNSPTLFLYPQSAMPVTVTPTSLLTYTDPPITTTAWQGTAHPNGSFTNQSGTRPYIYYEYDKAIQPSTLPDQGFVVATTNLQSFLMDVSNQLHLLSQEQKALTQEVAHAIGTTKSNYVILRFVPQDVMTKHLPLAIFPVPSHVNRIHIAITPTDVPVTLNRPTIQPVVRSGFTVVELGAFQVPSKN